MREIEPQIKRIRVSVSAWAIAYHVLRTGKDTFTQSELKSASCGTIDAALADGLIEKLDNGLYKANIELARLYVNLLPKACVPERRGRFWTTASEAKVPCYERQEALRLAMAWTKLANWAEIHAEDKKEPPKEILEVLNKHGIEVQRMVLPSGAKAVVARVLNYYIVMDSLMAKSSPKCLRFPRLGSDAMLCASTREKLFWHITPLTFRPQN